MGLLPGFSEAPVSFARPYGNQALTNLYFNTPAPQTLTAPRQTLGEKISGYIANKVRPVLGQRMAQKVAALPDYTPVGALTQAYQLGNDLGNGNYGSAIGNAIGTALNAVPDVGPLAKG